MSVNHFKTPMGRSLDKIAHQRARDAVHSTGKALPCTVKAVDGTLVTVNFDVSGFSLPEITVPTNQSAYVRIPIQQGDTGVCFPADARIGGITGQGGPATAALSPPGNLSALTFFLTSSTAFPAVDSNAVTVTAPNGAVLQDAEKACVYTQTPTGSVFKIGGLTITTTAEGATISVGGMTASFSSSGLLVTGGDVKADAISLKGHLTSAVQSGGGVSGVPIP